MKPDQVDLTNDGFTASTLFDPKKKYFIDGDKMEEISEEFDKIFELNRDNCQDHVFSTLSHLDEIGYLPFSFAIPPKYWEHVQIEGFSVKDTQN